VSPTFPEERRIVVIVETFSKQEITVKEFYKKRKRIGLFVAITGAPLHFEQKSKEKGFLFMRNKLLTK